MGIGLFMVSLGIVVSPISPLYAATLTQSETIQLRYLEQQAKSNDRLIKNITNTIVSLWKKRAEVVTSLRATAISPSQKRTLTRQLSAIDTRIIDLYKRLHL